MLGLTIAETIVRFFALLVVLGGPAVLAYDLGKRKGHQAGYDDCLDDIEAEMRGRQEA
jgi:hypothetical protein